MAVMLAHFSLALTFSRYSHFRILDLEYVGQDHGVQHSKWYYSMTDT